MEIFSAFTEPTVISFLVLGLAAYFFPDHGKKAGYKLINLSSNFSKKIQKRIHVYIWKRKKRIISIIYNPYKMQWRIIGTHSYMILFILSFISYIILLTLLSIPDIENFSKSLKFLPAIPVYVFEILWLTSWMDTKKLINIRSKRKRKNYFY